MATSLSLPSRPRAAQQNLQDALATFRGVLNDDQRKKLQDVCDVPKVDDIMLFTAQLDYTQRTGKGKGRSFSSRLYSLLLSVGHFCAIVDTYVSAHPDIAALVWGSIKLAIMITMNFVSYYDATSELFMKLGRQCPLISEYQALFPESTRLQTSIHNFYASIIRCCKHLVETMQRPWQTQLVKALRMSFDQEFKPDLEDIERLSSFVNDEISLAKAQADSRHQQDQVRERSKAAKNRSFMGLFVSRTDHNLDKLQSRQIEQQSRKEKARYLNSLSTYDYMRPFKQSSQKRYGNTANWVFETPQFQRWLDGESSILWCSGKIGSGKTVITASAIQHILRLKGDQKSSIGPVSFFFVQSDDDESVGASSILRSLLRQRLEGIELPPTMQGRSAPAWSDISDLFVQHMPSPQKSFIFIDGLDECDKDRKELLKAFSVLCSLDRNIHIFLASRLSLRDEIKKHFTNFEQLTLDCEAIENDISNYVEGILDEKLEEGDFKIGDHSLLGDIKSRLIQGANGMFLWVFFQLETIFSLHCDEDIRHALNDLPKGLAETFQRALRRIEDGHHGPAARKVFPWVAASKRPLSLDELREATAIEVGQRFTILDRRFNDMEKIASWCQNLVFIDEETQLVQFTHLAVKMFLLDKSAASILKDFHITINEADHMLGEICVTYLNFNDFKTTIAKRPKAVVINTSQILPIALKPGSKRAALVSTLKSKPRAQRFDLTPSIAGFARDSTSSSVILEVTNPFLKYASAYWIMHSASFQEATSTTWVLWKNMVTHGHPLAQIPWHGRLPDNKDDVLHWSYKCSHYGIIRLLISHYDLTASQKNHMLEISTKDNNVEILDIFLRSMQNQQFDDIKNRAFQEAVEGGHLGIVDRLLAVKADVNTRSSDGWTILQKAAERGHLEIVDRLLAAKADVNAGPAGRYQCTALQAAAQSGHLEITDKLLAANAAVNAQGRHYGNALQAASNRGYREIVQILLDNKADVNAQGGSYGNALQAASAGRFPEIVQLLIDNGADVNAQGGSYGNALQAASARGYREIVQILLDNKADVNAQGGSYGNALQAASAGRFPEIVQLLIDNGADVNAQGEDYFGNALQTASDGGYQEIVQLLIDNGADVNAQGGNFGNALQAASYKGYQEIVQLLIDNGADVNAQGGVDFRNALQAASAQGHREIVKRLEKAGALMQS